MPIAPLSDDDYIRAFDIWVKHGRNYVKAAEELGIVRSAVQNRVKQAVRKGLVECEGVYPGFEISSVKESYDKNGELTGETITQRPEAGEEFKVPPGYALGKMTVALNAEGRVERQWLRASPDNTSVCIDAIRQAFSEYEGRAELCPAPTECHAMRLSVYVIADQHLGLMAWGRETGENYDLRIGAKRLRDSMSALVAQTPPSESAIILNLGDFFHADDGRNVTPASGHRLDVDGRYFKVLTTGVRVMQDCIDMALQRHQRVTVRNIAGNHDPHVSVAMTVALGAFYHDETRVVVSQDPSEFFYHRFGKVFIGANHGHRVKPRDMALHMAATQAQDWGATTYRHFLFGHIHRIKAEEVPGVIVESFQSPASRDAFSAQQGYVSGRSLQSLTFDYNEGLKTRSVVNIGPPA